MNSRYVAVSHLVDTQQQKCAALGSTLFKGQNLFFPLAEMRKAGHSFNKDIQNDNNDMPSINYSFVLIEVTGMLLPLCSVA